MVISVVCTIQKCRSTRQKEAYNRMTYPKQLIMEDARRTFKLGVMHEIAWKYDAGMIGAIFLPIIFSRLPSVALCSHGLERTLILGATWTGSKANMKLSNGRHKNPHGLICPLFL